MNAVREIVRWPLIRSSLVLFLLISSFIIGIRSVMAQPCGTHTGDLYDLPACAIDGTTGNLVDNAYLTSVEPQTIIALPGENVSFTITYQVWAPTNTCVQGGWFNSCFFALLFYPSWNHWPRGPGIEDFDKVIYNSAVPAGGPPGMKGSASIQVNTPINTGTYYLYFYIQPSLDFEYPVTAPRPLGYIKIMVATHTSTVTVFAGAGVISSPLSNPVLPFGLIGVVVAVVGSIVLVKRGKLKIRSKRAKACPTEPTISTGYPDLDTTLEGGIPEGYAVLLVSPSYDERDLLLRKIIDSSISSGRPVFYISADIKRTQDLLTRCQRSFYAFSPKADKIQPNANLYKIPGVENLSEANISLTLALKEARAKEQATKAIMVIDILSDLLVRYKGVTTRKWLSDFVDKRKVEGFTTLATLNPLVGTKEENQMVIDVFDGVIEIFEKELRERSRRFVIVKKMYGKKYSESELMLDKDKLF